VLVPGFFERVQFDSLAKQFIAEDSLGV